MSAVTVATQVAADPPYLSSDLQVLLFVTNNRTNHVQSLEPWMVAAAQLLLRAYIAF